MPEKHVKEFTKAELEEMERKMNAKAHLETMFDDEKDEVI